MATKQTLRKMTEDKDEISESALNFLEQDVRITAQSLVSPMKLVVYKRTGKSPSELAQLGDWLCGGTRGISDMNLLSNTA